jgi:hypothetical protein
MRKDSAPTQKDPIRSVLQGLKMYQTVEFPLERMPTVRATTQILYTSSDVKFTTKKNKETQMLEVTRIPKPKM